MQLNLAVGNNAWINFLRFRKSSVGKLIIRKVLLRDKLSCQFCGFKAEKFQNVLLKPTILSLSKLTEDYVTCCSLCMQCQFLGARSFGKIIYLPELTQVKLNSFVRSLFVSMSAAGDIKETAMSLYRGLRLRTSVVEKSFGIGMSDSLDFGRSLSQVGLGNKPLTGSLYVKLRLLPNKNFIEKAIVYWKQIYSADIL